MKNLYSDKNNPVKETVLIILLFLLIPALSSARQFKVIQVSDGLSNNTVKSITQDKNGFIWLGTFGGLCRFDGHFFSTFTHDPDDSLSISGNHISAIQAVSQGIWIGTDKGLDFFSFHDNKFHSCIQLLPSGKTIRMTSPIVNITTTEKKTIALNIAGELLIHKKDHIWEVCTYYHGAKWISATNYKKGTLLAYSANGVYLLDPENKKVISRYHYKTTGDGIIYYSKNQDLVYIGYGLGHTTDVFKIDSNLHFNRINTPVPSNVKSIADYKNRTVFATDGEGLIGLEGNTMRSITPQNSTISSDAIFSLFTDKDSNLWIGTYRGGVNLYSDRYNWFSSITMGKKQLTHNMVSAILARNNQLYVGLDGGGLNVYDLSTGKTKSYTTTNSEIPGNNVISLSKDEKYVWLGIYGKGLCRYSSSDQSFKIYKLPYPDTHTKNIRKITDTKDGCIWVLGSELLIFNKNKEKFIRLNGFKTSSISHLVQDREAIWMGCSNEGIFKIDKKTHKIQAHYHKNSPDTPIPSNTIRSLFIDSKHRIWFSTEQPGLYKLEENRKLITFYPIRHGLKDLNISATLEENNNLWIGTHNGLLRFNTETGTSERFENEDQIPSTYFNDQACFRQDSIFYFGTTEGLAYFNPNIIKKGKQPKPVYFTDFELISNDKKTISLYSDHPKKICLPYNQNFFTIHFSVPEFVSSEKIQFSCNMKNLEKEWREISQNRYVTYTNVPPGEYIFQIRSSNGKGGWNEHASYLHITITKPWWATYWAFFFYLIILLGILFLIFRFYRHTLTIKHMVQLKEMEKNTTKKISEAKLNFFTNITHELRTPIFLITAPLEELLSTSGKGSVKITQSGLSAMYRNAMRLNKLISRIIDFRKLESDKLNVDKQRLNVISFCRNLTTDYEALCSQKEISFHFQPSATLIQLDFDPEKLETILSNLVSNAFKYTPDGGKIVFSIDETGQSVIFSVRDNGIGIKKEYHEMIFEKFFQINTSGSSISGDGIGLSFVKYLVELHGGSIKIESEPEKGCNFIFNLPKTNYEKEEQIEKKEAVESRTKKKIEYTIAQSPANVRSILIIDDEKETVDILERSLVQDFKILKAANGVEGLAITKQTLPDLVICDIMMPKMDGTEFLSLVKKDKTTRHIPIMMFTAKTLEEDEIAAFDQGADAYLTKPISLKYLRKRIDHLLIQNDSSKKTELFSQTKRKYSKEEQRFLLQCRKIIDDHLTNTDFNVILFAKKMGMSHSALYKKIRQITDLSILDFIIEYKIFKAVLFFKEGETNINNVVARCGFKDVKSFREAFKRKMKMTPKQYVKNL